MIRIGTSGWHYKHWYGIFYAEKLPPKEMLPMFSQHFDTVEINNTFYALPLESTFRHWKEMVPPDFCFAVKGSRYLTHVKKLKEPEEPLKRLLELAEILESKLGPILFQFPRTWSLNMERLEHFLDILPLAHRYVFEFRHPSWFNDRVYTTLHRYHAAFCFHDSGGTQSPLPVTTDFVYVRMHGGKNDSNYADDELDRWAMLIDDWSSSTKHIYIYFNNDTLGFALNNARYLKEKIKLRQSDTVQQ